MSMERLKNAVLVFCLFILLVVIFSSYFRASEVGMVFGALAGTPLLVRGRRERNCNRPRMSVSSGNNRSLVMAQRLYRR